MAINRGSGYARTTNPGDIGYADAVSPLHVLATIGFAVGNDITGSWCIAASGDAICIVASSWHIVGDSDYQSISSNIAVAIGQSQREAIGGSITRGVVIKGVAVAICAARESDDQRARRRCYRAASSDVGTIDSQRSDAVAAGRSRNCTIGNFAICG